MTFKEACELARIDSGDLKGQLRPSTIQAEVNWAYREVAIRTHCWKTDNTVSPITLIADQEAYALTSLTGACVNLVVAEIKDSTAKQTYDLNILHRSLYNKQREDYGLDSSEPEFITWTRSNVWLCPAPSTEWAGLPLELYYAGEPVSLTGDSDTFLTPPEADDAILKGAIYKLKRILGKPIANEFATWFRGIETLKDSFYACDFWPDR